MLLHVQLILSNFVLPCSKPAKSACIRLAGVRWPAGWSMARMSTAQLIKELIQFGIEVTEEERKRFEGEYSVTFLKRFECFLEDFLCKY